jgi:Flp pilus assembly protein TadG
VKRFLHLLIFAAVLAAGECFAANISGPEPASTATPAATSAPVATPAASVTPDASGNSRSNETAKEDTHGKDDWDKANVIATILGAVGTVVAAGLAWLATKQAQEAARQTQQTATQSNEAAKQAEQTARDQRLVELFGDIQTLTYLTDDEKEILSEAPGEQNATEKQNAAGDNKAVGDKVITNLNIMEKIAFCWDRNLVDREAIENEVRPFFTKLYEQIEGLPKIASLARDGKTLVAQSPMATQLCKHLLQQTTSQKAK